MKISPQVKKVLQDLVRIPSVNPRDGKVGRIYGEKKIAGYVARMLQKAGIPARLEYAASGRPNVFAQIRPSGRPHRRILIDAHLDTVEVEGMKIAPFSPELRGNKIYGRGSCDCKASVATAICALMLLDKKKIKSEISFCATVGEEHNMLGAQYLMKRRRNFDWAIVGEPTARKIIIAHKGAVRWRLTTFGLAVHGARPHKGINAIYKMSDFIQHLNKVILKKKRKSHPLLGRPVFNLGKISGGSAFNIVPDRCTVSLEHRFLPGEKINEITRELKRELELLRRKDPKFRYQLEFVNCYPAMELSSRHELVSALNQTVKKFYSKAKLGGMQGATDAGAYSQFGIPSVVFGPGSPKAAHRAVEYVKLSEVIKGVSVLKDFLENN